MEIFGIKLLLIFLGIIFFLLLKNLLLLLNLYIVLVVLQLSSVAGNLQRKCY